MTVVAESLEVARSNLAKQTKWSCFGRTESTLIAQEDLHAPYTLYERVSG